MSVLENPFRSPVDVAKKPYGINVCDEEYKVLHAMFECNTYIVLNITPRHGAE
jgi:hypothetical protein